MPANSICNFSAPVRVLAAALFVFSALFISAGSASAEVRELYLYNNHTKETARIAFKRNGKYIKKGLKDLNRFLRDWRRNEPTNMDPRLFDLAWEIYRQVDAKKPIHVVSAYRSPATNAMLRKRSRGVAKKSQHTLGKAMDFFIPGVPLSKLRAAGLRMQIGGVGYYPRSGSPFVHMDTGRVRHWPRMTRKQLASVFPKGDTIHVPTDGKPMKNAKAAASAIKKRGSDVVSLNRRSSGGFFARNNSSREEPRKRRTTTETVQVAKAAEPAPAAPKKPEVKEEFAPIVLAALPESRADNVLPAVIAEQAPATRPGYPQPIDQTPFQVADSETQTDTPVVGMTAFAPGTRTENPAEALFRSQSMPGKPDVPADLVGQMIAELTTDDSETAPLVNTDEIPVASLVPDIPASAIGAAPLQQIIPDRPADRVMLAFSAGEGRAANSVSEETLQKFRQVALAFRPGDNPDAPDKEPERDVATIPSRDPRTVVALAFSIERQTSLPAIGQ